MVSKQVVVTFWATLAITIANLPVVLMSHLAVVTAGAGVSMKSDLVGVPAWLKALPVACGAYMMSDLVVVIFWAMMAFTVAYMPMCQGPQGLAIENWRCPTAGPVVVVVLSPQRSRRDLACCVSYLLQLVWKLLTIRLAGCCPLGVVSQERCEATVPGGVAACTRPARMLMLHRWTQVLMSGLWLVVMLG